jgi:hypothetical protein
MARVITVLLLCGWALNLQAADHVKPLDPSGDCRQQVAEKHHRWNPLDKLSDFALKVSSVGIEQAPPVCSPVARGSLPKLTERAATDRKPLNAGTHETGRVSGQ